MHHQLLDQTNKRKATENSPQLSLRYWLILNHQLEEVSGQESKVIRNQVVELKNKTQMRNYWTCNSERYPKLPSVYTGTKGDNYDACKAEGGNLV